MARVADLMDQWAQERGIPAVDRTRWRAAGHLHDALREEKTGTLRTLLAPDFQDLPGKVLHGPGAALRLARDGVEDGDLLRAIRFHTLGSAEFDPLGLALYAADFLEPGRRRREEWRADLRARAGSDLEGVVREILSDRIHYLLDRGRPVHPTTLEFWNRFSEGKPWASASEC
jgi:2-amino-4-hydroxy-6-hydroxymethyldihydropteridine diphosphokinase